MSCAGYYHAVLLCDRRMGGKIFSRVSDRQRGYELYDQGDFVDQFNPMPDYFEEVSEEKILKSKGDAQIIARYFHVEKASVERYLVRWSEEMLDEKAYADDEFGYEDWQMADFMRKLGYPYDFDEE